MMLMIMLVLLASLPSLLSPWLPPFSELENSAKEPTVSVWNLAQLEKTMVEANACVKRD